MAVTVVVAAEEEVGGVVVVGGAVDGDVVTAFVVCDGVVESTVSGALELLGLLNKSLLEHDPKAINTTTVAYGTRLWRRRSVLIGCVRGTC
ncbi:MAG: hypothetical protein QOE09_2295 [Ilumatobacteraceae bacterium]